MGNPAVIVEGRIGKVTAFADGNVSYTLRDTKEGGELYRFTEPTAMSDTKGRGLLHGSIIQAELKLVVDANGNKVVKPFDMDDGEKGHVVVARLGRWYLVDAALSADDKRISAPLIAQAPATIEA